MKADVRSVPEELLPSSSNFKLNTVIRGLPEFFREPFLKQDKNEVPGEPLHLRFSGLAGR